MMFRVLFSFVCALGFIFSITDVATASPNQYVDKKMTEKVAKLTEADVSLSRAVSCIAASQVGAQRALDSENELGAARGYRFAEQTWGAVYDKKASSGHGFEADYKNSEFFQVASSGDRELINGHVVSCMSDLMTYLQAVKKGDPQ